MNYKKGENYWILHGLYGSSPRATEVKYIYPAKGDGSRHWVTTTLKLNDEFNDYSGGLYLQAIVEETLLKVDGKNLFLTKEDAERALALEERFHKLEHPDKKKEPTPSWGSSCC